MPQIIVTAGPTDEHGRGTVMLRERVTPVDFESERFAANLVERLGWAVLDAIDAERRGLAGQAPAREGEAAPHRATDRRPLVTA